MATYRYKVWATNDKGDAEAQHGWEAILDADTMNVSTPVGEGLAATRWHAEFAARSAVGQHRREQEWGHRRMAAEWVVVP